MKKVIKTALIFLGILIIIGMGVPHGPVEKEQQPEISNIPITKDASTNTQTEDLATKEVETKTEPSITYCLSVNKDYENMSSYWDWEPIELGCDKDIKEEEIRQALLSRYTENERDNKYCHSYLLRIEAQLSDGGSLENLESNSGLYTKSGTEGLFGDTRLEEYYHGKSYEFPNIENDIGKYFTVHNGKMYLTLSPSQADYLGGVVIDYSYYNTTLKIVSGSQNYSAKLKLPFVDPFKCIP